MSWLKKAVKKVKNGFKKSHWSRNIRRWGGPVDEVVRHTGLRHTKLGEVWRHPNRFIRREIGLKPKGNSDNNARSCCRQAARNAGWTTVGATGFHRFVGGVAR